MAYPPDAVSRRRGPTRILPDDAGGLRYVYVSRVRCPRCGGDDLVCYKTFEAIDGTTSRYTRCRAADCAHRFIVVVGDEPATF